MGFVKGQPKTPGSGRKAGTPNRLTATVRERLEELGCDPIDGMAQLAMAADTEPELRGRMYAELAQYVYPKRKAVEHTGPNGALFSDLTAIRIEIMQALNGMPEAEQRKAAAKLLEQDGTEGEHSDSN